MLSFELAASTGVDALEFDVHLSADGRVVVIHDADLGRTTDRSGAVAIAHARRDPEAPTPARDSHATAAASRIAAPAFAFRRSRRCSRDSRRCRCLIELKTAAASAELRRVLAAHGAEDRCVIGSFDHAALALFREPPWHASGSQHDVQREIAHVLLGLPAGARRYEALSIPPSWRGIPLPVRALARDALTRAIPVHVWTVDRAEDARRLWGLGVTGIISNDPAAIIDARREATRRPS